MFDLELGGSTCSLGFLGNLDWIVLLADCFGLEVDVDCLGGVSGVLGKLDLERKL